MDPAVIWCEFLVCTYVHILSYAFDCISNVTVNTIIFIKKLDNYQQNLSEFLYLKSFSNYKYTHLEPIFFLKMTNPMVYIPLDIKDISFLAHAILFQNTF